MAKMDSAPEQVGAERASPPNERVMNILIANLIVGERELKCAANLASTREEANKPRLGEKRASIYEELCKQKLAEPAPPGMMAFSTAVPKARRSAYRARLGRRRKALLKWHEELADLVRDLCTCSITMQPFKDPVVACDGHTYELHALNEWRMQRDISPLTREPFMRRPVYLNRSLRTLADHRSSMPS